MEHPEPNDPKLDKAWDLLKSAKTAEPSPYFSRNVVREVRRLEEERKSGWLAQLKAVFAAPAFRPVMLGAAACATVALLVIFSGKEENISDPAFVSTTVEAEEFDPATEMAGVEYFGQLMAVADPAQLDDAALAALFF